MQNDNSQKYNASVRPEIYLSDVKILVFDLYGLTVTKISRLSGYDDKIFHILVDPIVNNNQFIDTVIGCGYVLKIINTLDSQDDSTFEAQTELLLHLNENDIKCPKPILTKDEKPFKKIRLSSGEHVVKLLEHISGDIQLRSTGSSRLLYKVGVFAAKLNIALQTFDHPAFHKNSKWCLRSAPDILNYLHVVKDQKREYLVKAVIEEFSARVLSVEDQLDKGIIHGDINEQNIILDKVNNNLIQIKAITDFDDAHYACYLYELAIAMTYMIFMSEDVGCGEFVLAGYSSVRKITDQELKLLWICVLTRFCQSLVLGAYASSQEPYNVYISTTAQKGWELLSIMKRMSEDTSYYRWMAVLNADKNRIE